MAPWHAATVLISLLLHVSINRIHAEKCSDLAPLPIPFADLLLTGTVRANIDERIYGVQVNDTFDSDLRAHSSCWIAYKELQLLLIEESEECTLGLTLGQSYLFSLRTSQSSCPSLFHDGTHTPALRLHAHPSFKRSHRVVRQASEEEEPRIRIPYPDDDSENY